MKKLSFILFLCLSLLLPTALFADYSIQSGNSFMVEPNINFETAVNYYKNTFNSEQIKVLQKKLNELGYDCGTADGIAGKKTITALIKFQEDKKLTADGIPNSATLEALGISLNAVTNNNSYIVALKNSYMEYNNHVGNEWGTSVKVNGTELNWNESIKVDLTQNSPINISVTAMEYDSIPDVSSTTKKITTKDLADKTSLVFTISTTVVENRGRYSGNTAKWVFEFEITKADH